MCGIAGLYAPRHRQLVTPALCQTLSTLIRHRGPDDEGAVLIDSDSGQYVLAGGDDTPESVWRSGLGYAPSTHLESIGPFGADLALINRRLAIQDLSAAGHMPMGAADSSTWLVFNGQVYNFHELRAELAAKGHAFVSSGDTEVVLKAYLEWGPSCVERFNGMWAIALWDGRRRHLMLSRDRLGIKPLYYFNRDETFGFASEIKCLLAMGVPPAMNERLAWDYVTLGLVEHTEQTFFAGIHKVPAGHTLIVRDAEVISTHRYWDFRVTDEIVSKSPDAHYAEQLHACLESSVTLRLRSDVAVGSCLSGGLDSSSIVALTHDVLTRSGAASSVTHATFSACAHDPRFDEREYIDVLGARIPFERHDIFPEQAAFLDELQSLMWHQEEPFGSTSIYAQWCIMKESRRARVKVLLDGQGADEQLLGYRKFRFYYLQELLRQGCVSRSLVEGGALIASPDLHTVSAARNIGRYFNWRRRFGLESRLFRRPASDQPLPDLLSSSPAQTLADRIKQDLTRVSLPALLRYEDKNSMAHSVETRLPFLDYRFIELIASFPSDQKLRRGWTKYVLRNAMEGRVPDAIRWRRTKMGFVTPETRWFREMLGQVMEKTFSQAQHLSRFVDVDELRRRMIGFRDARQTEDGRLFLRLFLLEHWAAMFLTERRMVRPPTGRRPTEVSDQVESWA